MGEKLTKKPPLSARGRDGRLRGRQFRPRTPLGKRLWEIRAQMVSSGTRLLDWDEIEQEVAERRGERRSANS